MFIHVYAYIDIGNTLHILQVYVASNVNRCIEIHERYRDQMS